MTREELDAIKAREAAATPGPWAWEANSRSKHLMLWNSRRDIVMDFTRYGTSGASPRFNVDGIMRRADELARSYPGLEHHIGYDNYIDHPDAKFIAHAKQDVSALAAEVERLWEREGAAEQALAPLPAMLCELAGALENMLSLAAEAQGLAESGEDG